MKKRLLLHSCCGPCLSSVFERVREPYATDVYWFNPNIDSQKEHDKRLEQLKLFPEKISLVIEQNYEQKSRDWLYYTKEYAKEQEGGERCKKCFEFRLRETAKTAQKLGYDLFTTTLSVSPHKDANAINEIGSAIAREFDIEYLSANFKKQNGYQRSIVLAREYGLYRQEYCGCIYSREARDQK